MDDVLGVGFSLHADLEYLELARPILEEDADYFEVNPETMWRKEGDRLVRNDYRDLFRQIRDASGKPFVAHGLALSLGSALDEPGEEARLEAWLERIADDHATFEFEWISEHLGWIQCAGRQAVLPLPLPFTQEAADLVSARLRRLAEVVPDVAFENSANYFLFGRAEDEPAFLNALLHQTPCALMLDLHNVYTQAVNMGFDAHAYVDALDLSRVVQIHLSGGSDSEPGWLASGRTMRLDSHDGPVPDQVWDLLAHVLPRCTRLRGILVERLNGTFDEGDVPLLSEEVHRARSLLEARTIVPATGPPEPESLPRGEGFGLLRRWLVDVFHGPDAATRLRAPTEELPPSVRESLDAVDPDGFALTALIVRKLRFERLCMGDRRIEAWFDGDPHTFSDLFADYAREVPPTPYFPNEEATSFHAWRIRAGIEIPTGLD